jgi:hypothetical protein
VRCSKQTASFNTTTNTSRQDQSKGTANEIGPYRHRAQRFYIFFFTFTCRGIVLSQIEACSCGGVSDVLRNHFRVHSLYRIHFLQSRVLEQAEPSDAEDCVKDVYHVSRSIS